MRFVFLRPFSLILAITPFQTTEELAESYVNDVKTGVVKIMQNPTAAAGGMVRLWQRMPLLQI